MSRKYLWDKIFYGTASFDSESAQLAMLSGLVRRLKCCAEAVIDVDKSEVRDFRIPLRGSELLCAAMSYAGLHNRSSDDYLTLLDELDNAGDELVKGWKPPSESFRRTLGKSHTTDVSWVQFFCKRSPSGPRKSQFESFLELAIAYCIFPYVASKIRDKALPRPQLQYLLLQTTLFSTIKWRRLGFNIHPAFNAKIAELLFQEGVDPNCQDTESDMAMASKEGWTAWTSLLLHGNLDRSQRSQTLTTRTWIETVILFLKYGSDPTVQWCWQARKKHGSSAVGGDSEDSLTTEIYTPDIVINAVLGNELEYEADLSSIMELLSRAKAEWETRRITRCVEDVS